MPVVHLTARNVPTLPAPATGRLEYWDDILPGFVLRVSCHGARTYVVWYRLGQKRRRYTIGRHPQVDLATARARARMVLADRVRGKDAADDKAKARLKKDSFSTLMEDFFERVQGTVRPRTLAEWKRIAKKNVQPQFGHVPPDEITRGHVRRLIEKIASEKPIMANRVFAFVRRVFNWAVAKDLVDRSPCHGLSMPSEERQRDRVYRGEEIRALLEAVPGTELEFLVPLIFHTAVRSGEARSARWADIDFDENVWTIPSTRSKNKSPHPLPLSKGAVDLLTRLKETSDSDWLFPAPTREGYMDQPQDSMVDVRSKSGIADFRLHDIRRTVATGLAEAGTLDAVIEAVLGHTPPTLKRVYNRYTPMKEMRAALDGWSKHLVKVMTEKREPASAPQPERPQAKLLAFRAR